MGETTTYFVPERQDGVSGRGREIAAALAALGLRFEVCGSDGVGRFDAATGIADLPDPTGCSCASWADGLELTYDIPGGAFA